MSKNFPKSKLNEERPLYETDIEKFKKTISDLYKMFPNGSSESEIIRESVVTKKMRDELVNKGVLCEEKSVSNGKHKTWYTLGCHGLSLVSSWKMEELTDKIKFLTYLMMALNVISIAVSSIAIAVSV